MSTESKKHDHDHGHGHDHDADPFSHACACGCSHSHEGKENNAFPSRLVISALLYTAGLLYVHFEPSIPLGEEASFWLKWGVIALGFGLPYLLCGTSILLEGFRSLLRKDFFNEFTLMCGATMAAIALGNLPEAVGVMLFYCLGEYAQEKAAGASRRSIRALLAEKPTIAHRLDQNGTLRDLPPEALIPGMRIVVKPGEKIPVDGVVLEGESFIDTSPLSGESVPVRITPGQDVFSGTINMEAALTVRATSSFQNSSASRILELVEHAASRKAPTERFITRFARYYTPVVTLLATLTALLPPLLGYGTFHDWIYRGLVLLVISCPCALVVSIPLGYFGGIGAASKKGILIKGGAILDALPHIKTVALDKTGTLTRGIFDVKTVLPAPDVDETCLLETAAKAECRSNHPVARSITRAAGSLPPVDVIASREVAGKGVITDIREQGRTSRILAGNRALLEEAGIPVASSAGEQAGTVVLVARNGVYLGAIAIDDTLRPDSVQALDTLRGMGKRVVMLTGDNKANAARFAQQLGIHELHAELLPEGKAAVLQQIAPSRETLFAGDGINDAPVIATAGVGVAMGGLGAEAAIETADVVLLDDSPMKLAVLFRIADATRRIVRQNIVLSLGIKVLFLVFGVAGLAGLWEAVFADVGVALLAVLNASRTARI